MTATPTTFTDEAALAENRPMRVTSASRRNNAMRTLDLFCLCRKIAYYTDSGRTPPRRLLEELGVRPPE